MKTSAFDTTRVNPKLKQYGIGAAAIAGAFGLIAQDANAAIVPYSSSGSIALSSNDQIFANLPDGTFVSILTNGGNSMIFMLNNNGRWDNTGEFGGMGALSVLGANSAINATAAAGAYYLNWAFSNYNGPVNAGWASSFVDQYVGFKTTLGHEGYLKVSWDVATGILTYNGGAIEDTGADLTTPGGAAPAAVPEPGVLALLATGAVGALRRRRASRAS